MAYVVCPVPIVLAKKKKRKKLKNYGKTITPTQDAQQHFEEKRFGGYFRQLVFGLTEMHTHVIYLHRTAQGVTV